jgi:hypothetical protein
MIKLSGLLFKFAVALVVRYPLAAVTAAMPTPIGFPEFKLRFDGYLVPSLLVYDGTVCQGKWTYAVFYCLLDDVSRSGLPGFREANIDRPGNVNTSANRKELGVAHPLRPCP